MSDDRRRRFPVRRCLIAASLGLTLVAGCVDWSKDVDRYRALLDANTAPSTRPAHDPDAALTLLDALKIANADNETIATQGETYIQALADKMRQAGVFLPTLTLAPQYTLTRSRGRSGSAFIIGGTDTGTGTGTGTGTSTGGSTGTGTVVTSGSSGSISHQFSVPLRASVSGSLSDLSTLEAAATTVEEREQLLYDTRETVLLQVVQAYYTVLRNERQVAVYESGVRLRQEQVRDQEARLRLQNARPLDVAQSQANLAATRAQLTQARTDAQNARSALARLMGVDAIRGPLTDAFAAPAQFAPLAQWQSDAMNDRQDLIAAARAVESARQGVEGAIRQYFPSVSINFNYFLYNDPRGSQIWTSGISANMPLFSGLQIESDIRRAWSIYRQAGLAQTQTVHEVQDDIAQAYHNLEGSRSQVIDLQIQVEAAQRAVDLAERAYALGSETNLNRLTQQDSLLTAQLNLLTEQFNEKQYYLSLVRASGQLGGILAETSLNGPTSAPTPVLQTASPTTARVTTP